MVRTPIAARIASMSRTLARVDRNGSSRALARRQSSTNCFEAATFARSAAADVELRFTS
jgi:hypothetical protein